MRRTAARVPEVFARRETPGRRLADSAEAIARTCHAMAERFHRGGRLFTFGNGCAATDAQHIAVEFVHPVVVGKRALPALSLTADVATLTGVGAVTGLDDVFAYQLRHFGEAADIALGVSPDGGCAGVRRGLATARDLGMLTVALLGGDGATGDRADDGGDLARAGVAAHVVTVPSADPRVVKEVHVTAYHVLWELVHVFLDRPGVLTPEGAA